MPRLSDGVRSVTRDARRLEELPQPDQIPVVHLGLDESAVACAIASQHRCFEPLAASVDAAVTYCTTTVSSEVATTLGSIRRCSSVGCNGCHTELNRWDIVAISPLS